jgi:hypothetical protein
VSKFIAKLIVAAIATAVLAACQTTPPTPVAPPSPGAAQTLDVDSYHQLAARGEGQVFRLDPSASQVLIYAFRGGAAAFAGHNHVVAAPDFQGYAFLPAKRMKDARFDLQFALAGLVVDDPALRRATGGGFAGELNENDISGTREHMLGDKGLEAERYPVVTLRSVAVAGELPRLVAEVAITLHGQTRKQLVPLNVQHENDALTVSGALALRQADFGVTPYTVLGGLLSVQDEIAAEFRLVGHPARFDAQNSRLDASPLLRQTERPAS